MTEKPGLSVIIVAYEPGEEIIQCIESIFKNVKCDFEIIIVDNSPSRNLIMDRLVRDFSFLRIIDFPHNPGFGAANNAGAAQAKYGVLLFINPDTSLLSEIGEPFDYIDEGSGIVSGYCVDGAGNYKKTAGLFPENPLRLIFFSRRLDRREPLGSGNFLGQRVSVQYTEGSLYLMSSQVFDESGRFDENIFMYGEDYELSYRVARSGKSNWIDSRVIYFHKGGFNYRREPLIVKGLLYFSKKHIKGWRAFLIRLTLLARCCTLLLVSFIGNIKERREKMSSLRQSIYYCVRP